MGALNFYQTSNGDSEKALGGMIQPEMTASVAPDAAPAPTAATDGRTSFTNTNVQVAGVDEGDIVKTDGTYLYVYSPQQMKISILKVAGKDTSTIGTINLTNESIMEMYIAGDKLVTVSTRYEDSKQTDNDKIAIEIWRPGKSFATYKIYDLTNRATPTLSRTVETTGSPLSTRLVDNMLYIVATQYVYATNPDNLEDGILPMTKDTAVSNDATFVDPRVITCFPNPVEASYQIVGAVDVTKQDACEFQTFLGAGSILYMTKSALYVTRSTWDDNRNFTEISKFTVDGATLTLSATGKVPGTIGGQYAVDEYEGNLRITTSDWQTTSTNTVYVLDSKLSIIGSSEPLAPGETVQSVRYAGQYAYVVTFRQVDPLFVIDLADPTRPTVVGELKIPGFSTYLHPVGDGYLVGFGRHTQEMYVKDKDGVETVVGVRDAGAKVSLFDVRDPANPKEVSVIQLGENSYSEAFNNPRAMMVDATRDRFAFDFQSHDSKVNFGGKTVEKSFFGGIVIDVKDGQLTLAAQLKTGEDYAQRRLVAIDDAIYLISGTTVSVYDYNNFAELGSVSY